MPSKRPEFDSGEAGNDRTHSSNGINDLQELIFAYRQFVIDRDWQRFQTPKNLAAALSVEASELLEIFTWLPESHPLNAARLQATADEMADVFLYLLRLADVLNIDLLAAARAKFLKVQEKYPIDKARELARSITDS